MSYSISIAGHKDVADSDEGRAFEEGIAEQAREFVASLEGVTSAQLYGGNVGSVDLVAKPETASDGPTEEPTG